MAGTRDVIVADNDYIIRDILRSMLKDVGFAMLLATDGLEAVDLARRTQARLVILDYRMPRLDGIAACAEMRRLPGYTDVPIIILSAFADTDTREAAEIAGATGFIAKPFKAFDLLRGISKLLGEPISTGAASPRYVWRRRDPAPLFGEPVELSEGRRVLNICRR